VSIHRNFPPPRPLAPIPDQKCSQIRTAAECPLTVLRINSKLFGRNGSLKHFVSAPVASVKGADREMRAVSALMINSNLLA
jgi:hypothetical protein